MDATDAMAHFIVNSPATVAPNMKHGRVIVVYENESFRAISLSRDDGKFNYVNYVSQINLAQQRYVA